MKAKDLIKILEDNPDAEVTISVSDEKQHFFADRIIEVTNQGDSQVTIVADINKASYISDVIRCKCCGKVMIKGGGFCNSICISNHESNKAFISS